MKETTASVFLAPDEIQVIREKNPRRTSNPGFSEDRMTRLRESIKEEGLNHALLVRKVNDGKYKYRLIAGERRLRSIQKLREEDQIAESAGEERVLCKDQRNGKMEPAQAVYKSVECKVSDCADDREARRLAIEENVTSENLTEYELLLQVEEMEHEKFTRAEQAKTMRISEAWISQSHSLLKCHQKILDYMREGKLTRTAALTFLPIPMDKVEAVLDTAVNMTYKEGAHKIAEATKERQEALAEIEKSTDGLRISKFLGDCEKAKDCRRSISKAGRAAAKAEKVLRSAEKKKNKKITVETIATAAKQVDGAGEGLKRTVSMAKTRQFYEDVKQMFQRDDLINPENGNEYDKKDVEMLVDFLGWQLGENAFRHPLEILKPKRKRSA